MQSLLKKTSKLSLNDKRVLISLIQGEVDNDKIGSIRLDVMDLKCPHCGTDRVHKHGTMRGRMRFKCSNAKCGKTFNDMTGTFISCIKKKNLWVRFIGLTIESKSIRKISGELGVSMQTVFDWRHKVLTAMEGVFTKDYKGIVEMDDYYTRFNQKGRRKKIIKEKQYNKYHKKNKRGLSNNQVSILFTTDRYGTIGADVLRIGKINLKSLKKTVETDRLNPDNIFCVDKDRSLISWLRDSKYKFEFINSSAKEYVKEGIFHVQHVNNLMQRYGKWIKDRFSSVSTKYLRNYLNYFKMMDILKGETNKVDELLRYSLIDGAAYERNLKHEWRYQRFIYLNSRP